MPHIIFMIHSECFQINFRFNKFNIEDLVYFYKTNKAIFSLYLFLFQFSINDIDRKKYYQYKYVIKCINIQCRKLSNISNNNLFQVIAPFYSRTLFYKQTNKIYYIIFHKFQFHKI